MVACDVADIQPVNSRYAGVVPIRLFPMASIDFAEVERFAQLFPAGLLQVRQAIHNCAEAVGHCGAPMASVENAIDAHQPRDKPGGRCLDAAGLEGCLKKPLAPVLTAPLDPEVAEPQRPQCQAESISTAAGHVDLHGLQACGSNAIGWHESTASVINPPMGGPFQPVLARRYSSAHRQRPGLLCFTNIHLLSCPL